MQSWGTFYSASPGTAPLKTELEAFGIAHLKLPLSILQQQKKSFSYHSHEQAMF